MQLDGIQSLQLFLHWMNSHLSSSSERYCGMAELSRRPFLWLRLLRRGRSWHLLLLTQCRHSPSARVRLRKWSLHYRLCHWPSPKPPSNTASSSALWQTLHSEGRGQGRRTIGGQGPGKADNWQTASRENGQRQRGTHDFLPALIMPDDDQRRAFGVMLGLSTSMLKRALSAVLSFISAL